MATKDSSKKTAIITFLGIDGACAAALVLRKYPGARMYPSSAHGIHRTLRAVRGKGFRDVHVCGVGIKCPFSEVDEALAALKKEKVKVHWYCGYSYLAEFRDRLEQLCDCRFLTRSTSITGTIGFLLGKEAPLDKGDREIIAIGTHPDQDPPAGSRDAELRDLVSGSIWRYLNYRDRRAYPHAVRALAGEEAITDTDRRTIEAYNRSGSRVLVGKSDAMDHVRTRIAQFGAAESPVLVTGETGTGKEIVSRLIHESSSRAEGPFCAVNCATLTGTLEQDVLFGHARGAFTDAKEERPGMFEVANGGTLFLDEVGEMAPETQAMLLRALQEGMIQRAGEAEERPVDVRVVAATNRDLREDVQARRFRSDLYFRIAVLRMEIPPLRDRRDDIPVLARDILYRSCTSKGIDMVRLKKRQLDTLVEHRWPGNVRELENVLEQLVVLGLDDVSKVLDSDVASGHMPENLIPLAVLEARYVKFVYERVGRNKQRAAEVLGIARNTLKAKLQSGS